MEEYLNMKEDFFTSVANSTHKKIMRARYYKAISLAIFFNRRQGNAGWNYDVSTSQKNLQLACTIIGIPYKFYPNLNPDTVLLK